MSVSGDDEDDDEREPVDRPLGIVPGIGWGAIAYLAMFLVSSLMVMARPGRATDLVGLTLCSALAFAACAYALMRLHLPTRPLSEALSLRSVNPLFYLVGALAGVALLLPSAWVAALVEARWPYPEDEKRLYDEAFTFVGTFHKVAFAFAAVLVGPAFEDLLFRGVLFRALRRTQPASLTILATSAAFALAHAGNVRGLPYVLLGGLVLGLLRELSGSVLVSLAAHVAYNGVEVGSLLVGWLPGVSDSNSTSPVFAAAGAASTVLLLVLAAALGRRLDSSRLAREEDVR
jgi:membrane protease YdiL (CAAX protease family)